MVNARPVDDLMPYPGYSWSLSQHMRRACDEPGLIYHLLRGAQLYGRRRTYRSDITDYVGAQGLIPPNIRMDRSDIWRDYQQILNELGLIIPTPRTRGNVVVTRLGMLWLSGMIGNRELLTTQALRYQYPNGYKLDIPNAVRREIFEVEAPNRVWLDVDKGILLKPAVLILRLLLQLGRPGAPASVTAQECVVALIPTKRNDAWGEALERLRTLRRRGGRGHANPRETRQVQEWFGLLRSTDLFVEESRHLRLSDYALANLGAVASICEQHEQADSFWIPENRTLADDDALGFSWIDYYGTPHIQEQWMRPEEELSQDYVDENYPTEEDTVTAATPPQPENLHEWENSINPTIFDFQARARRPVGRLRRGPSPEAMQNILEGIFKRAESTVLHEDIVHLIAARLSSAGFRVEEARQSVDILATRDDHQMILEVKTVTPRNLKHQIRYGVGQLAEYRYRTEADHGTRPFGALILSSSPDLNWLPTLFSRDLALGLVSMVGQNRFRAHTNGWVEEILTTDA